MKQLLLRVDDELHADLTAHATAQGRSVNSIANEVLIAAVQGPAASRRERLNQRLAVLKIPDLNWGDLKAPAHSRDDAIAEMEGTGRIADELVATERDTR